MATLQLTPTGSIFTPHHPVPPDPTSSTAPSLNSGRKPIDVGELLDNGQWNGYLKLLVSLTALTIIFDGADNQLLGIAIPSLIKEWALPRSAFAPLLAIGMAGMIVGGTTGGLVGDRFGRKTALLGSVVLFGVATLGISFVNSVTSLGILRFFAGIGLGAAMPNAAALTSEYVPRRQRPIAVTLTIVCVPLGGMLAAWTAEHVLPAYGWRTLFVIGGLAPLVTASVLIWLLAESPRFLARAPQHWPKLNRFMERAGHPMPASAGFADPAEGNVPKATLAALLAGDFRRDTIGLWIAFASCMLAVYASFSWIPTLLSGAGLGPLASRGLMCFNLGGVVGAILGAIVISRFGSKSTMLTLTAAAVASSFALGAVTIDRSISTALLLTLLTLSGTMINAVQTTMYALAAHVYPAAIRATGVGSAASVGRIGGLMSAYVGAWAMDVGGTKTYFITIGGVLIATFAGLALVQHHVTRSSERR
ncbi:MAG: 4-hydroxybenzoate transporter PcaK [Verrucomicrobiota bacterium]|jgi:AAHS family 4-hydroxybenzoate transporter-like MFS transporter